MKLEAELAFKVTLIDRFIAAFEDLVSTLKDSRAELQQVIDDDSFPIENVFAAVDKVNEAFAAIDKISKMMKLDMMEGESNEHH